MPELLQAGLEARFDGFEMPALSGADRWQQMHGCAMGQESTTEWQHIGIDEAQRMVESGAYMGYITVGGQDGCMLCKLPGGSILTSQNGVPPNYTLHVMRTHGLPPTKFNDKMKLNGPALRPGRGEGLADTTPHLCLFKNVAPNDLSQGSVGDCWLISAFAALAEFPDLVMARSKTKALSVDGRYELELFHPIDDKWVTVTVDDRIPVDGTTPRYGKVSQEGEVWPLVYEKAVAKLFGGYEYLEGNTPLIALKALTGVSGDSLLSITKEQDGTWVCLTPKFRSLAGNAGLVKTQWPFGGGTANKKYEEVFELLEDFDDFNCIMGASASEPAGGGEAIAGHSETRGHEGIVYGHAYSLLQAEDDICGTAVPAAESDATATDAAAGDEPLPAAYHTFFGPLRHQQRPDLPPLVARPRDTSDALVAARGEESGQGAAAGAAGVP